MALLAGVPPVDRDALTHHLYVPKLYLALGGIVEIPSIPFSYFPMNLDLLYMISLFFGNDIVPKYIHFSFGLATAFLVYVHLAKRIDIKAGILGALLFLSIPVIAKLSITVYVDLGLIFFSTASLLALLHWMRTDFALRYLLVAGACCGLAAGCKYNGLITIFVLSGLVPIIYQRSVPAHKRSAPKALAWALFFVVATLLTFSPWFIRNITWTGNPIYPLYNSLFQEKSLGAVEHSIGEGKSTIQQEKKIPGAKSNIFLLRKQLYGEDFIQILLLPIRYFYEGRDNDPRYFDGKLNPFLLIFPLLPFLFRNGYGQVRRRENYILLAFALLFFLFSFFSETQRVRYVSPILPALVILSIQGFYLILGYLKTSGLRVLHYGAMGLVVTMYLYNFQYVGSLFAEVQPLGYLSGKVTREQYISARRPEYPLVRYLNDHVEEDAVVQAVFLGKRGYYFDRKVRFDTLSGADSITTMARTSYDAKGIAQGLRKNKVTHLFIRYDMFDQWIKVRLSPDELARLETFFHNYTTLVSERNNHGLFRLL
ncbi:MAG: phospholipid carrier-dependent glycosyltransferase [Desulfobulbaceae bacterium]|nr:phospholipid carrier-dependent glycosyltransferase [Desulfobulbaceae bacterium]